VGRGVSVLVGVGATVPVTVGVAVSVRVLVAVGVRVGRDGGVGDGVMVAVLVDVRVSVGRGVRVGSSCTSVGGGRVPGAGTGASRVPGAPRAGCGVGARAVSPSTASLRVSVAWSPRSTSCGRAGPGIVGRTAPSVGVGLAGAPAEASGSISTLAGGISDAPGGISVATAVSACAASAADTASRVGGGVRRALEQPDASVSTRQSPSRPATALLAIVVVSELYSSRPGTALSDHGSQPNPDPSPTARERATDG
jgi:hypothetical protein